MASRYKNETKHFTRIKCGRCRKVYHIENMINELLKQEAVPGDKRYGYVSVCTCGYVFHKDKWLKRTRITANGVEIDVSSVFLEMSHISFDNDDVMWYESMLFINERQLDLAGAECNYQNRYRTKKEAVKDHNRLVKLVRAGKFKVEMHGGKRYVDVQ